MRRISRRTIDVFRDFFESERLGGLILLACTALSILLANSGFGAAYSGLWKIELPLFPAALDLHWTISHWINDGLMTIFFLLVGLEIERELYIGELSNFRKALLPIFAAVGGMVVPMILYLSLHLGRATATGFGIPMATDIAFSLGILSLVGRGVPLSLKVFLTALAIIDDLGAIVVIAIFYAAGISWGYLAAAAGILAVLFTLNRMRVNHLSFYIIPGILLWYCLLRAGIHPTIAGVFLAFAIPFHRIDALNPSYKLQEFLHKPVAFFILPLFALANTAILLPGDLLASLTDRVALGVMLGLLIGKPLGIFTFTFAFVKMGICRLPAELSWRLMLGLGFLGGIGFTMSIFITNLAFGDHELITTAKLGILLASAVAALIGFWIIKSAKRSPAEQVVEAGD
jgi:NhaA family Na+:H+ antiporter